MSMKRQMKLNHQLALTLLVLLVGSIIAFCVILPISMKYFVDHKMFDKLLVEQDQFTKLGRYYDMNEGKKQGVYHLVYNESGTEMIGELDDDLIHQKLMYKDFFLQVIEEMVLQQKPTEMYKFIADRETIYYIINGKASDEKIVSYIIDGSSQSLFHQLFMNTLLIIVMVLTMILISFFKWNNRFINNLKEIQLRLDYIGEGKLDEPIEMGDKILEFQEVMYSLERMRERLYGNEQIKQKMIHNISHDLKTPIAVIKNYAEGIIDGVYPYGTVERTARVIYKQADHLQKRVQGLLYLNRLEYIKDQKEKYDFFDMEVLMREVVGYMQERDSKLTIQLILSQQMFYGDIEKWRIVIENLFDNAKRYAKEEIIITLYEDGLAIFNDGEAIEEEVHGSLFEPFEVGKGGVSGLGLAIVKKTVNIYGYAITFENEDDGGVTFIIYKDKGFLE